MALISKYQYNKLSVQDSVRRKIIQNSTNQFGEEMAEHIGSPYKSRSCDPTWP